MILKRADYLVTATISPAFGSYGLKGSLRKHQKSFLAFRNFQCGCRVFEAATDEWKAAAAKIVDG